MKVFFFSLLLLFSVEVICQEGQNLSLPKPEEIDRIEISNTGMVNWYKPEELLELLPKFIPSEGSYMTKGAFQRGIFVLKNGKKITWMVGDKGSILLYSGGKEQLYLLPKEKKKKQETAGPLFAIWDADGKEGFIDINGNVVYQPTEEVRHFSEGLAPVKIGDKWGYADLTGRIAIAPRWKTYNEYNAPVGDFSEGLAAVYESAEGHSSDDNEYWTYECGYIDKTGKYVIKPVRRQHCGPFHDGLAEINVDPSGPENLKNGGLIGYIDTKGNWAIKPKFFRGGNFWKGYALVADEVIDNYPGYNFYLVDKNGVKATGVKDCRWRYRFSDGLALAFSQKEKRFDGYLNENCEYVIKLPADIFADLGASDFSQGLAAVYKQRALLPNEESYSVYRPKTWGYIDITGKIAIPIKYRNASPFSEGFAIVGRERDGDTYIDLKGNAAFENRIGSAGTFENGLAFQMLHLWTIGEKPNARNIYGYMNKQGKYVWLSPRAEVYLKKEWIKENYIGPQKY